MNKYIPILFFVLALPAFARGHGHRRPVPPPVAVPTPTSTPVTSGITLGAFNANVGTVTVTFVGWERYPARMFLRKDNPALLGKSFDPIRLDH
jgi:hypothetical protein